ncbi:hypothetical protein [uncultured Methanofollis sp.]|uniref:hypothetical protein n=1 Tax=uncultured Methanofollis sp. TaxID=262500 RepID=UPI002638C6FE|nr:hypothetical protein [uncultured Methanofollis sp.]
MCSGTVLLYKIPRVVIGENRTFQGPEEYLRSRGVEVVVLDEEECVRLMTDFIAANPEVWNEDIGEEERDRTSSGGGDLSSPISRPVFR